MVVAIGLLLLTLTPITAQDNQAARPSGQQVQQLIDRIVEEIAEPTYLSDTDMGYQAIEGLQRAHCYKMAACRMRQRDCVQLFFMQVSKWKTSAPRAAARATSLALDPGASPGLFKSMCQRVSTRYESPGFYSDFSEKLMVVTTSAEALKLVVPKNIRIGSLAIGSSVNASAFPTEARGVQLILVDVGFMDLANELTKVVARAMPSQVGDKTAQVSLDLASLDRRLDADPTLLLQFRDRLALYLGRPVKDFVIEPSDFSFWVSQAYYTNMELFAVAHETAHAIHGHTATRALEPGDVDGVSTDGNVMIADTGWADEVEADVTGLRILKRILSSPPPDSESFEAMGPFAVEYYFTLREIMQKAQAKWLSTQPSTTSTEQEGRAFEQLRPCIDQLECDITDYIVTHAKELAVLHKHPSYALRRRLARYVLGLDEVERKASTMSQLAVAVRQNANRMWQRLETQN